MSSDAYGTGEFELEKTTGALKMQEWVENVGMTKCKH